MQTCRVIQKARVQVEQLVRGCLESPEVLQQFLAALREGSGGASAEAQRELQADEDEPPVRNARARMELANAHAFDAGGIASALSVKQHLEEARRLKTIGPTKRPRMMPRDVPSERHCSLQDVIGHDFEDATLQMQALTHPCALLLCMVHCLLLSPDCL